MVPDMKLNPLVSAAAVVDVPLGLLLLFLPQESMAVLLGAASAGTERTGQLAASAILGVAGLNWFNRYTKTGGIYGRPLVFANILHKMTLSLLLAGDAARGTIPAAGVALTIVYGVLAMAFAYRMIARAPAD